MQNFELPSLTGDAQLEDAFRSMIRQNVSGVVAEYGGGYHLLHFSQLRAAVESGAQQLSQVPGAVSLRFGGLDEDFSADYDILPTRTLGVTMVRSRRENYSFIYMSPSPGYACTGPLQHTYPPHKRRAGNHCVVPGCPGTI